jgi:hypothetical protein
MARNFKHLIRKSHRYIGLVIGVQLLLWTVGGAYFSWNDIREIRGETIRNQPPPIDFGSASVPVSEAVRRTGADVTAVRLVTISGSTHYEMTVGNHEDHFVLVNAADGSVRPRLDREEAERIAVGALKNPQRVVSVDFLKTADGHHEYREKPLPAWGVTFADGVTVYVGADNGQITAIRTGSWRVFDFLWMLHTMDFKGRDDINNYVLRAFSVFGLATVLSGFILFFASSPLFRRVRRKTKED